MLRAFESIHDLMKLLMYLFEGINTLLKLGVIRWKLSLHTMFQQRSHDS